MKDVKYNENMCKKAHEILNKAINSDRATLVPVGCGGYVYKYTFQDYTISITKRFPSIPNLRKHARIITLFKGDDLRQRMGANFSTDTYFSANIELVESFVFDHIKANETYIRKFTRIIKQFFYYV